MSPADVQRYKKLLLEKQLELLSVKPDAEARVPRAGASEGDLIDQANADAEAELQIRLHETDGRLLRAIEEALARMRQGTYGVCEVVSSRSPRRVLKLWCGRATAATARSRSTPQLN
jgi:DnaK suppressor protein